ncbi:MAG TPA: glycosyltransferase family 39 protein, partial [Ktedonobacteraceae bacterium]|nr:glycosyltransferase family 39 protein [Ktedonobacteraceae bacterium]
MVLALLLIAALSFGSFRSRSITIDEVVDIPSGLSYWQKQDTRLNVEHPPLLKMIAAVPLLFAHVKVDYNDPSWCAGGSADCEWEFGKKLVEKWNANPQHLLILARIPMLGITLLLGWTIYAMARRLAGRWGGALSLVLFATSPFYLGLGPLVVTDIGLPLFVLAAVWRFSSLWSHPNGRNTVWFALSLACALLSKFSALMLFPTFFLLWLYFRVSSWKPGTRDQEPTSARRAHGFATLLKSFVAEWYAILGIALAGALVYLFYLLTCWHSDSIYIFSARAHTFGSSKAGVITGRISLFLPKHPLLAKLLSPLWLYLSGILDVYFRIDRRTYVLGKWHQHGVWYYFPVVSFFKLAPGMIFCIAFLVVLLGLYILRRCSARTPLVPQQYRRHLEALIVALIVFAASAISSTLNIGIRHFSVPITFLVLLCALVVPLMKAVLPPGVPRTLGALAASGMAVSSLATALLAYPHYIPYYNFFRLGTPKQEIANNSNLYWGQSLIDLERFRQEHHISKIYVDSRTFRPDPAAYVSGASEWECGEPDPPAPEWAAVNATFLLRDAPTCAGLLRY